MRWFLVSIAILAHVCAASAPVRKLSITTEACQPGQACVAASLVSARRSVVADAEVPKSRDDLPSDVIRKKVPHGWLGDEGHHSGFFGLMRDLPHADAVVINASIDFCLGRPSPNDSLICQTPGVHLTVCVATADDEHHVGRRPSYMMRQQAAASRAAEFAEGVGRLLKAWPLSFFAPRGAQDDSHIACSSPDAASIPDVTCSAAPLYRRMATLAAMLPPKQRGHSAVHALELDSTKSFGRGNGHPSQPHCFVSSSLNPFHVCSDTFNALISELLSDELEAAALTDDLTSLPGVSAATEADPIGASWLSPLHRTLAAIEPMTSQRSTDVRGVRRTLVRSIAAMSQALRANSDFTHISVRTARSVSDGDAEFYARSTAAIALATEASLTVRLNQQVGRGLDQPPHATPVVRVSAWVEPRGEGFGRHRTTIVVRHPEASAMDEFAPTTVIGAADVILQWPRLMYKPYAQTARLALHTASSGPSVPVIAAEPWPRLLEEQLRPSFRHPCFGEPSTIAKVDSGSLVATVHRVRLFTSHACARTLVDGEARVDLLIDFDFAHLHADEYAPDMNRMYAMPPAEIRVRMSTAPRGTSSILNESTPQRYSVLGAWIDAHVANAAESGAVSPQETKYLVSDLMSTFVHRDWPVVQWAVASNEGRFVSPPIPDRAMPFNALAFWATIVSLTTMGVMNVVIRGNAGSMWGPQFAEQLRAEARARLLA